MRYKPGMNCLVAYTAVVDGEAVPLYAKAHRPDARDQLRKAPDAPAARSGVQGVLGAGKFVLVP